MNFHLIMFKLNFLRKQNKGIKMKKIYLTIVALLSWAMMSASVFAIDIIVVSHGQANDPFWSVAKNGVDKACKDMKVSCKYNQNFNLRLGSSASN